MSKTIPLTKDKVAIVDDADFEWLNQYKWWYHSAGYAVRGIEKDGQKRTIYMHRSIIKPPSNLLVDHRNLDGLDNRQCNLRMCTHNQNHMNSPKRLGCTSRYKGVCWDKVRRKWETYIRFAGRRHHLGRFNEESDAARAYNTAATEHFGIFARLNEIPG